MPYASPEDRRAYAREYARKRRELNPEASRAAVRVSYQRAVADPIRKARLQQRGKAFRESSPNYAKERKQVWDSTHREKVLWTSARRRAAKAGLPFDIEVSDIVIPEICPMLGGPITTPSLDRIVNHLGYVKGNVCVVEKNNNRLKSNATVEQLEKIIDYIKRNSNAQS